MEREQSTESNSKVARRREGNVQVKACRPLIKTPIRTWITTEEESEIIDPGEHCEKTEMKVEYLSIKLKEAEEKNVLLCKQLDEKDQEIRSLKEGNVKETTHESSLTPPSPKRKIPRFTEEESEIQNLKDRCEKSDKKVENLNQKLKNVEKKNAWLEKQLEEKRQEIAELKIRITTLEEVVNLAAGDKESAAWIHFGELCCQVQNAMYKHVLPNVYTSGWNYKIKHIKNDIQYEEGENKVLADQKFQSLRSKFQLDELENVIIRIQDTRNWRAHPSINEKQLRDDIKVLDESQRLKGLISKDRMDTLVDFWMYLKCDETEKNS